MCATLGFLIEEKFRNNLKHPSVEAQWQWMARAAINLINSTETFPLLLWHFEEAAAVKLLCKYDFFFILLYFILRLAMETF